MNSYKKIITILNKSKKSFTDLKNNSLKMSDSVIEYGLKLINNHRGRLGDEYYIILEEIFLAGLEMGTGQTLRLSQKCLVKIQQKFPESEKVDRMKAMLYEAQKDDEHSLEVLQQQISSNLIDTEVQKRKMSMLRKDGHLNEFIQDMNKYLEDNSSDGEAWMELADLYLETQNYSKAVYCLEELLILFPKKFFYMMKIAEIYYTIGGIQNLQNAKHYYSFVLSKDQDCYRAKWGLIQTCRRILQLQSDPKTKELLSLCVETLQKQYKQQGQTKLIEGMNWSGIIKN